MNASRTHFDRQIDWSTVAKDPEGSCQRAIVEYVCRRKYLTANEIKRWLRATPPSFVDAQLTLLVAAGRLGLARTGLSRRSGYVYSLPLSGPIGR